MVITSYINLLRRHRKAFIILLILALVPAAYIGNQKKPTTYDTTVFLSIAPKSNVDTSTSLDDTEAADAFTETVQGWFRNPSFLNQLAPEDTQNISASKQEKQNLLITYTTKDEQLAANSSRVINQELSKKINEYNQSSATDFTIALFDTNTVPDTHSFTLYLLLGLFCGLFMGVLFAYGSEYFYGVVIHRWQIEHILNRSTDDIIRNKKVENYNLSYILARIKDFNAKKLNIVGIDFMPTNLSKGISESCPKMKIDAIMFPDDAVKIADDADTPIVIVAKIGKSKLDNVHKISKLLKEHFLLITKE